MISQRIGRQSDIDVTSTCEVEAEAMQDGEHGQGSLDLSEVFKYSMWLIWLAVYGLPQ